MVSAAATQDSKALPPAPKLLQQQRFAAVQELPLKHSHGVELGESAHREPRAGGLAPSSSETANLDPLHEEWMKEYEKTVLEHSRADASSSSASTPSTVVDATATVSERSHIAKEQLPADAGVAVDLRQRLPGSSPLQFATQAEDSRQLTSSVRDMNASR